MRLLTLNPSRFEYENQIKEYVEALHRRNIPMKFCYIGSAAYTHLELVTGREYLITDAEIELIRANITEMVSKYIHGEELGIVDLGSSDGRKALIIAELISRNISSIYYSAIDYSRELALLAVRNVGSVVKNAAYHIFDFEKESLSTLGILGVLGNGYPNLFLLLGHTIGNTNNPKLMLRNISDAMQPSDKLLVGVELLDEGRITTILSQYQNETLLRAVFEPLSFIGLERADGNLFVTYDNSSTSIEAHFVFASDISVKVPISGQIDFCKGEKIAVFLSRRYRENEIEDLFISANLEVEQRVAEEKSPSVLYLLSK